MKMQLLFLRKGNFLEYFQQFVISIIYTVNLAYHVIFWYSSFGDFERSDVWAYLKKYKVH